MAAAWESGSQGERRLGELLQKMEALGYRHLADRSMPVSPANIDHLLVGPPGVFVIDAKAWSGDVHVRDGDLRQGGRSRRRAIDSARTAASTVAAALEVLPEKVDVRPALCFVGAARLGQAHFIDKVKLVDEDGLGSWIRQFPDKLDARSIEEVRQLLLSVFPAKVEDHGAGVEVHEPPELVVYLVPWKRGGKHRLYVRSNDGADVGYLDLVSGHCSSPSAEWEAILAQLLPHYLKGDTPGLRKEDLTEEAQGVIRRFLDSLRGRRSQARPPERPIIACYRWKRHGKDRLYLSRLAPGGKKVDLGSFDLDSGMLRANGPGVTATLGYCGRRFQELEQQRLDLD
ncbi:MAG: NERD domain-containing protein [Actinobacteria bacterium]|nr:NERD domain-containing protein [Actinomycetota bacterium]